MRTVPRGQDITSSVWYLRRLQRDVRLRLVFGLKASEVAEVLECMRNTLMVVSGTVIPIPNHELDELIKLIDWHLPLLIVRLYPGD